MPLKKFDYPPDFPGPLTKSGYLLIYPLLPSAVVVSQL